MAKQLISTTHKSELNFTPDQSLIKVKTIPGLKNIDLKADRNSVFTEVREYIYGLPNPRLQLSELNRIQKHVSFAELLVVDDSCDLTTSSAVKRLNYSNANVIHRNHKGGRGSAVIDGIKVLAAKECDYIIEMDADFSHPPSEIPNLINKIIKGNYDLVIASRYLPESNIINWPITRCIFSRYANLVAKSMLRVPVSDYTNGYRIYSSNATNVIVNNCGNLGKGFISLSETLVQIHYSGLYVGEIPTIFENRLRGESSLTIAEILNAFIGLLRIFYLTIKLKKGTNNEGMEALS